MTLEKAIDVFLNFKEKEFSKRTLEEYRKDLTLFLKVVGNKDIEEIKPSDVAFFRTSLKCGTSLLNRRMSVLSTFFSFLQDIEVISSNPVKKSFRIRRSVQKVPPALKREELVKVLKEAEKRGIRDSLIVKLMTFCGLRVSELLKLKKEDIVDFQGKKLLRVQGKGGKERFVPLPEWLYEELERYAEMFSERLFPLTYHGIRYVVHSIGKSVGVHLHPHKLRHTYATMLVERGIDIRVIQELLGHSSPSVSARYAKVNSSVVLKAIEEAFGNEEERVFSA
jgi:integrase/recombinase XerD